MSMHKRALSVVALAALVTSCATDPSGEAPSATYNLGTPLTDRELAGRNIDVAPDGTGLPPGSGSVAQGKAVYDTKCAACHGATGQGTRASRLAGGSVKPPAAVKTVGS